MKVATKAIGEIKTVSFQDIIDNALSNNLTDVEHQDYDNEIVVLTYGDLHTTTVLNDKNFEVKEFYADDGGVAFDPNQDILSSTNVDFNTLKNEVRQYLCAV